MHILHITFQTPDQAKAMHMEQHPDKSAEQHADQKVKNFLSYCLKLPTFSFNYKNDHFIDMICMWL